MAAATGSGRPIHATVVVASRMAAAPAERRPAQWPCGLTKAAHTSTRALTEAARLTRRDTKSFMEASLPMGTV